MRLSHATSIFLLLASASPSHSQTYAERMGWEKGARVLIINGDDAGMTYASNEGVIASIQAGITTSSSVMAPYPWVSGYLDFYMKNPNVCVGAHLTLCAEWDLYRAIPVAGAARVPSLADGQGCLHDNNRLFSASATPEEVDIEIRAQVDRLERAGFKLSHLDSHMWSLFQKPEYCEKYVALAIEKGLPLRIVGDTVPNGYAATADPEFIEACKPFVQRVWESGLPVLDDMHTASYNWKTEDKVDLFCEAIRNLKPGLTEFVVHPTKPDPVMDVITRKRILLYGDYYALTNPRILETIREEGVQLVSWTQVMERRRSVAGK